MYTYIQPCCKKVNMATYVHTAGGVQAAWTEHPKRGLVYRRMEETAFCSSAYGRDRVLFIGRGVVYRKTEETDFCWSAYGRNGVLFIGRGVAYRKTRLHGLLFIHC